MSIFTVEYLVAFVSMFRIKCLAALVRIKFSCICECVLNEFLVLFVVSLE